jgi:hypothetical protein
VGVLETTFCNPIRLQHRQHALIPFGKLYAT